MQVKEKGVRRKGIWENSEKDFGKFWKKLWRSLVRIEYNLAEIWDVLRIYAMDIWAIYIPDRY